MYKLYSIAGSCSTGITALMEKLNLEYEVIQRSSVENYDSIVVTNQVPALTYEDQVITEGAAIALFLLEKHCDEFKRLDINQKVKFYQLLMFNYASLHPAYSRVLGLLRMMEGKKDINLLQKSADKVSALWAIVNKQLKSNEFMFGDRATIIDYLLTLYIGWNKYTPEVVIIVGNRARDLAKKVSETPEFIRACEREDFRLEI